MSVDCFTAFVVNISIRDIVLLSYSLLGVKACINLINAKEKQNGKMECVSMLVKVQVFVRRKPNPPSSL
jgi:hypothetical protein